MTFLFLLSAMFASAFGLTDLEGSDQQALSEDVNAPGAGGDLALDDEPELVDPEVAVVAVSGVLAAGAVEGLGGAAGQGDAKEVGLGGLGWWRTSLWISALVSDIGLLF